MLALGVHRRVLGAFFSPDDAIKLEQARGLLPPSPFPWRWLASTIWPRVGDAMFGTNPAPWHAVNLGLHAACAVLVGAWARRLGLSRSGAFFAAGLFASSRFAFSVLHQVVGIEDLLALALALLALLAFRRASRTATIAGLAAMTAALICKETVALVPLVLLLPGPGATPTFAARARGTAVAMLPSVAALLALWLGGASTRVFGDNAYAAGLGPHIVRNLLVYASWTADLASASPGSRNVLDAASAVAGVAMIALLACAAWFFRRRAPAAAVGALTFLLALAPMLPLLRQVQAHYIYIPLAGVALIAGAALDAWVAGRPRRARLAPLLVAALVLAHAVQGDASEAKRFANLTGPGGLPADPWLRKSEALRHVTTDVGEGLGDGHERVVLLSPPELGVGYSARTGRELTAAAQGVPRYLLVRAVSDDGRALRVFHPSIDSVAWVPGWDRALVDAPWYLVSSASHLQDLGRGLAAQEAFATLATDGGYPRLAAEQLAEVLSDEPANARLHYLLARALDRLDDAGDVRRELERARDLARDAETRAAAETSLAQLARRSASARPGTAR